MRLLGIDTGGTFTDFVLLENDKLSVHKVLSTPEAPDKAILQGISDLKISLEDLKLIHGSTVATNAVLEAKGAKTVYISNYGLKDVLIIGRQARRELYNLQPQAINHLVKRELCLETGGRLSANAEVVESLCEDEIERLVKQVNQLQPDAVAINLIFSFLNPDFEQRIKAALPSSLFVSCSSDILPEYKEYERGMTTWLNAYVGPLVDKYLHRLGQQTEPARLSVMLSSGVTASAALATEKAVHMLLSGPAGGLQAAKFVGQQIQQTRILTLDMGGTSTDVALIDGSIKLSNESSIANYPVAIPMVDMHTIGAGGGSVAKVDEGGMLQVGPQSAGASPGPACYNKGGTLATVTDANVVLGRLSAQTSLGGSLTINVDAAKQVIEKISQALNCSLQSAALGIISIANEHMVQALRVISVQKGIDPREFSLMSFGGAGGLHVCDLADALGMSQAVVPKNAGVFSAFGMLVAPIGREKSHSLFGQLQIMEQRDIEAALQKLTEEGMKEMQAEGVDQADVLVFCSLDLRYCGQSFTLNVAWKNINQAIDDFHATHEQRYGHKLNERVELVNVRVSLKVPNESPNWQQPIEKSRKKPIAHVSMYALGEQVPVWRREDLSGTEEITGPALITEAVASTLIKPGWAAHVDEFDHLRLKKLSK